ncbi:unnamed protein product [Scytosiphon promiscuus]
MFIRSGSREEIKIWWVWSRPLGHPAVCSSPRRSPVRARRRFVFAFGRQFCCVEVRLGLVAASICHPELSSFGGDRGQDRGQDRPQTSHRTRSLCYKRRSDGENPSAHPVAIPRRRLSRN